MIDVEYSKRPYDDAWGVSYVDYTATVTLAERLTLSASRTAPAVTAESHVLNQLRLELSQRIRDGLRFMEVEVEA